MLAPTSSLLRNSSATKPKYKFPIFFFGFLFCSAAYGSPDTNGITPTPIALKLFETRVQDNPHDDANLLMLAQLQIRSAREGNSLAYHDAEHSLRQAIKVNSNNQKAKALLASALNSQHSFKEALAMAMPLINSSEKDVRLMALAVVGDAQLELGESEKAKEAYHLLETSAPNAPQVLSRLASIAEHEGRLSDAKTLLQRAIKHELTSTAFGADLAWYYSQLGELAAKSADFKMAEQHYQAALRAFPSFSAATRGLAIVATAKGDTKKAIDLYWRLLDSNLDPLLAYTPLAEIYKLEGNQVAYQSIVSKVLLLGSALTHSHHTNTHKNGHEHLHATGGHIHERAYALFLADNNLNLAEALHLMEHEIEKRNDPQTQDALAWVTFKSGGIKAAATKYQELLATGTKDPVIYYHAALAFQATKDRKLAQKAAKLLASSRAALMGLHPSARAG
jgi:tetratricopeptide (TPR) repeat protein